MIAATNSALASALSASASKDVELEESRQRVCTLEQEIVVLKAGQQDITCTRSPEVSGVSAVMVLHY